MKEILQQLANIGAALQDIHERVSDGDTDVLQSLMAAMNQLANVQIVLDQYDDRLTHTVRELARASNTAFATVMLNELKSLTGAQTDSVPEDNPEHTHAARMEAYYQRQAICRNGGPCPQPALKLFVLEFLDGTPNDMVAGGVILAASEQEALRMAKEDHGACDSLDQGNWNNYILEEVPTNAPLIVMRDFLPG
jgi:DNA-binding transcriptional MerR regulator